MKSFEEGDACPDLECNGVFGYKDVVDCSCHIAPPCNQCVENPLVCLECGKLAEEAAPCK